MSRDKILAASRPEHRAIVAARSFDRICCGRRARDRYLGLILAGAALQGPSAHTTFLLLAFAAGAAASLALALLAGNKVFAAMKRSLGAEEWIRRALGAAVLVGVVAISFGWDTGVLRRLSLTSTSGIEQKLVDKFHPVAYAKMEGAR